MATITEPMALDKTFNTTETTPRSQADVLAAIESAIRQGFGRSAADVSYDNTTSGLMADDVQEAIDELADEKVDKVAGKGLSTNDYTDEDKEALDNMELDIAGTQTVSGNPITLTDAAPINAESLVVELEPKQEGSGDPSPTNIRPITGYTECEVVSVGKNEFDKTSAITDKLIDEDGTEIVSYGNFHSDYIRVKGNESYYLNNVFGGSSFHTSIHYDENKNLIGVKYISGSGNQSGTITTFENSAYMIVNGQRAHIDETQVTIGSDAPTTYEPYHSSNATIQFGQTVYGGKVDFLTGVLTVDSGFIASYNGETLPSTWISDRDVYAAGTTPTTGAQVCYKLATPQTIQLTPTELKLLLKYNNIATNGTTINLGYQPDNVIGEVKGEIEKCAVDAEFMQFTDGTDTFTDVNLSLDGFFHTVSVVGSKIEQKRFICFEVMDKMGGALQGILASNIAFTDGAKTPSGTAFRAYIESLQMYVNFRIYGSGGSYTLAYQSETSFSASAFFVRVRMMNNL